MKKPQPKTKPPSPTGLKPRPERPAPQPNGLATYKASLLKAFGETYYGKHYLNMTDTHALNRKISNFLRDCVDAKMQKFFILNNPNAAQILKERKPGWEKAVREFYENNINNQFAIHPDAEPEVTSSGR